MRSGRCRVPASLLLSVPALRAQNRITETGELRTPSELEDQVSLDPSERRLPLQRYPHPVVLLFTGVAYGVPVLAFAMLLYWGLA